MTQEEILLATLTTDNNGECTYTYTGTGAGKIDLKAKYRSLQSEIYEVLDCVFKDIGTSSDYTTWGTQEIPLSRDTDCTTLNPNATFQIQRQEINDTDLCVEFDMNITYTSSEDILRYLNAYTKKVAFSTSNLGVTSGEWYHIKLVRSGSTITPYVDDVAKTSKTVEDTITHFAFVLNNEKTTTFKYKNFKMYPI